MLAALYQSRYFHFGGEVQVYASVSACRIRRFVVEVRGLP